MPQITAAPTAASPGEFHNVLIDAVQRIENSQEAAANIIQSFLSGQTQELHTVTLAVERADLELELGLQVRNKLVQGYQQLMQMQI